ncbi:MAG: hypothetical protein AB9919_01590 [Geobacteraceae bacterium]
MNNRLLRKIYYQVKPFIPRRLQLLLRRGRIQCKLPFCRNVWPIDRSAAKPPANWRGWPDNKRFALVLTHDVDTAQGQEKCRQLQGLEMKLGFRSSFNFVPRRYEVSAKLRRCLADAGFEVGVHGLYHDGKYYDSREIFRRRAVHINNYLREWEAVGFRSPSMQHNLEWIHDLDIEYDASTFDTDPFEPQSDGEGTIFPFYVPGGEGQKGYVELPYTLPQDFTLFILMREKNIEIWKDKLDWIAEHGGMALVNTHPDYMNFDGGKPGPETYPAGYYEEFLEYVKTRYKDTYWHALPREIARFRGTPQRP